MGNVFMGWDGVCVEVWERNQKNILERYEQYYE